MKKRAPRGGKPPTSSDSSPAADVKRVSAKRLGRGTSADHVEARRVNRESNALLRPPLRRIDEVTLAAAQQSRCQQVLGDFTSNDAGTVMTIEKLYGMWASSRFISASSRFATPFCCDDPFRTRVVDFASTDLPRVNGGNAPQSRMWVGFGCPVLVTRMRHEAWFCVAIYGDGV